MTIKKCKGCGYEINYDLTYCPRCGKTIYKITDIIDRLFKGIIFLGLFISLGLFVFLVCTIDPVHKPHNKNNTIVELNTDKINKTNSSVEILEKLNEKLFSISIAYTIEDIEIDTNDKGYSVNIFIKNENIHPTHVGYTVIKKILNLLITNGQDPYKEQIKISALVMKRVKGETGQDMVMPFGFARYDYDNDTIVWADYDDNKFLNFSAERRIVQPNYKDLIETTLMDYENSDTDKFWKNLTVDDLFLARTHGLNINLKNFRKETLLTKVSRYTTSKDVIQFLINNGANVNDTDIDGNTPLIASVHNLNTQIMEELIKLGANVNMQNKGGQTAISIAVLSIVLGKEEYLKKINLLIKNGAKLDIKNNKGRTPINIIEDFHKIMEPELYNKLQQIITH